MRFSLGYWARRRMLYWQQISSLGGLSFTGTIALVICLLMATGGRARLAAEWCLLFGAAMLAVVATKVAFMGWGLGFREAGFAGMSGHAARAAATFPVAFFLLFQNERARAQNFGVMLGVLAAAVVAYSRIQVHAHPPSEAWTGFSAGLAAATAFIARAAKQPPVRLRPVLIGICLLILLVRPAQEPVDSEKWIAVAAMKLSGHDRVYQRWSWKPARRPFQVRCRPGEIAHGYRCA